MGAGHIKRDVGIEAAAEIRESLGTRRYNKEAVAIQNGLWPLLRALFDSRHSWLLYSLE